MNRAVLHTLLLIGLLLPLGVNAQENDVLADVAISVEGNGDIWTGQQVTVNLDLKTTGFSFSNTHFNLPEVPGAFLMQTDTTTVKFTESIGGQTWQIIRYPLALFPQKAGLLEIPPISVRFSTSQGFGSVDRAFEFQTRSLQITANSPPGVRKGDRVITTSFFQLDHVWQPESGTAKIGDALTLTVSRAAKDISAMLLPPLPVFRTEGLAAYPQTPELNDKSNRGSLTGERSDTIVWVVEKPGLYEIPGIRFQWWDPKSQDLKQQVVPGLSIEILPSAQDKITSPGSAGPALTNKLLAWIVAATFAVLVILFLWLRIGANYRPQASSTEKYSFSTLVKACKNNQAAQTYSALHAWLDWHPRTHSETSRPLSLSEFARTCDDIQLLAEFECLQEALVTADTSWQGDELLTSLRRKRHKMNKQKTVASQAHLAPLNP